MASTKSYTQSTYSVMLLQKLLSLRDGISPLTLVLDSLQEPGTIVLEEFMLRAKAAGTRVLYASSFVAGPQRSPHVDIWVERRKKTLPAFRDEIIAKCQTPKGESPQKTLIVVDSLCQLARQDPLFVAAFISSLVSPTASVLGLYHADEDHAMSSSSNPRLAFGKPPPLRVLCHLATAIVRVHPLHEEVARKRARDRCEEEPRFGWAEGEGALFGHADSSHTYNNKNDLLGGDGPLCAGGVLIDMELRRRSGRAVVERFVVVWGSTAQGAENPQKKKQLMPWKTGAVPCSDITVMADHPLFAGPPDPGAANRDGMADTGGNNDDDAMPATTFSLGLTEKQRRDREGIVLPYFDAQTDIGAGEGGRILYDMGREDDFDDEEDEI